MHKADFVCRWVHREPGSVHQEVVSAAQLTVRATVEIDDGDRLPPMLLLSGSGALVCRVISSVFRKVTI